MGRVDKYKRQRAHVARENPKFLESGENGGPPTRAAVVEEFNRLVADNAYGRYPKAGAERPEGGVIPVSPPLKAVDLNNSELNAAPDFKYPAYEAKLAKDAKKAMDALRAPFLPYMHLVPTNFAPEPQVASTLGAFSQGEEETTATAGLDWATDLAAHLPSVQDNPVQVPTSGEPINPQPCAGEGGWSTVRSNRTNHGNRPSASELNTDTRGCFNCGEVGHRKADCPQPAKGGGRTCHNCKEEGHIARDCPNQTDGPGAHASSSSRVCYSCNQTGHISRDCPTGGPGKGSTGCFNCGEPGHKSFECPMGEPGRPSRFGNPGGGGGACYTCGERGHFARECTGERIQGRGDGWDFMRPAECHQEPFPAFNDGGFDMNGPDDGVDANGADDGYNW